MCPSAFCSKEIFKPVSHEKISVNSSAFLTTRKHIHLKAGGERADGLTLISVKNGANRGKKTIQSQ